jgi:thiamine-monophosphate kinase
MLMAASFAQPQGQQWFGDDAAVLGTPPEGSEILFCTDVAVEGVHGNFEFMSPQELGWRAASSTLSDIAAMGGSPWVMVASVACAKHASIDELMEGVVESAAAFSCPVVGGDVSEATTTMVSIAVIGHVPRGTAVTRSGAHAGDTVFVTGPLGGSAAGLAAFQRGEEQIENTLRNAYLRPVPLLAEGAAARECGISAMIDVSDGLSIDLHRLADASHVGFELTSVPVCSGATLDEALGGGEDFALVMTTSDPEGLRSGFEDHGLEPPISIGMITPEHTQRIILGESSSPVGWVHNV